MRLKQKLTQLLNTGVTGATKPKQDFGENQEIRNQIKQWMEMSLPDFCRRKPSFDMRHGLVAKLLKTEPQRLKNGVLTTHDMKYWLRQNKPVPALWVVRLAGQKGIVARNEFLRWAKENIGDTQTKQILNWTKKWGIPADSYAQVATAAASTVQEARKEYAKRTTTGKARQILGNTLLREVAGLGDAQEVYAFFKSLNKDIVTFQIMFSAMVKNHDLLKYWDEIWAIVERQEAANNIKIDDKLRSTAQFARQILERITESGKND